MVRVLPLFALLSIVATTVESSMGDIMVTCNVDEATRSEGHCTESVWDEIEAALLQCSSNGIQASDLETFEVGWELYTPRPAVAVRRNLRQERDLRRCTGTCYRPRSSCCLLHCSFCAGKCNRCACSRRLSEEEEIEEVLANRELTYEDDKHDQRRLDGRQQDVIDQCVIKLEALRARLLSQNNLCMGGSSFDITCDAFLYGDEGSYSHIVGVPTASSPVVKPISHQAYSHQVCQGFAVHASNTVAFIGSEITVQGGDVSGIIVTGVPSFGDSTTATPEESKEFATYVLDEHATAMKVEPDEKAMLIEIGAMTFTPGTYRSGSAINFAAGIVTLDGLGDDQAVFIFKAGSTLTTAAATSFKLINGAKAENILWVLGTAATLGFNSVLEGSILAGTAITIGTKAVLHGCALAQTFVSFPGEGSVILD
jgi:hypothetical protein